MCVWWAMHGGGGGGGGGGYIMHMCVQSTRDKSYFILLSPYRFVDCNLYS